LAAFGLALGPDAANGGTFKNLLEIQKQTSAGPAASGSSRAYGAKDGFKT
jgi:hypothetical protein